MVVTAMFTSCVVDRTGFETSKTVQAQKSFVCGGRHIMICARMVMVSRNHAVTPILTST
uniref:Uncharacterized protein n=1 Tax=Rhizophora mucronata TaxID=61149 RepID=A0A2P2K1C3_RHIMU